MSIGNTKDKGNNYGNNYPYQLAVLKLLDQIANAGGGGGSCPCPSSAQETTLLSVLDNVTSKMDRIRGAANYSRTFTYHPVGTDNITVIVHTGTTLLGTPETITETFTYVDPTTNGSNITSIVYS
jgi:hypothetical protein